MLQNWVLQATPAVLFRVGLPLNLRAWEKSSRLRDGAICLEWFKVFLLRCLRSFISLETGSKPLVSTKVRLTIGPSWHSSGCGLDDSCNQRCSVDDCCRSKYKLMLCKASIAIWHNVKAELPVITLCVCVGAWVRLGRGCVESVCALWVGGDDNSGSFSLTDLNV